MPRKAMLLLVLAALAAAWTVSAPRAVRAQTKDQGTKAKGRQPLPRLLTTKPLDPAVEGDAMRRLQRERYNAALDEVRSRYQMLQGGSGSLPATLDAFRRLLVAGMAVATTGKDRLAFLEEYVTLTRRAEEMTQQHVKAGQAPSADAALARYLRLDAEIQLLHSRRLLNAPQGIKGPD